MGYATAHGCTRKVQREDVGYDSTEVDILVVNAKDRIKTDKFATTVTNNATTQMSQLHTDFLSAYNENTKALSDLMNLGTI